MPISSPNMTRMLGFCCAHSPAGAAIMNASTASRVCIRCMPSSFQENTGFSSRSAAGADRRSWLRVVLKLLMEASTELLHVGIHVVQPDQPATRPAQVDDDIDRERHRSGERDHVQWHTLGNTAHVESRQ